MPPFKDEHILVKGFPAPPKALAMGAMVSKKDFLC